MMIIDINKQYRTNNGLKVRILCTDARNKYPVIALIGDDDIIENYTIDGRFMHGTKFKHDLDLVEVPETTKTVNTRSVWVNVYPNGKSTYSSTKEWADYCAMPNRLSCIEATYEVQLEGDQ